MQETDAVSCLLCLQPDEYGAMIKVCVPRNSIPPSTEKVICRRCAAAIFDAAEQTDEGVPGDATIEINQLAENTTEGSPQGVETDDSADYVSDEKLPERET